MTLNCCLLLSLLGASSCSPADQPHRAQVAAHRLPVAPPRPKQAVRRRTRLDSLTTTRQVQQLVRAQPGLQTFTLTDSLPSYCAGGPGCAISNRSSSWLKADFDGNGRTDLLVTGYYGPQAYRRDSQCLLDSGRRTLSPLWFTRREYDCAQLQLVYVKGRPAIRLAHNEMVDGFSPNPRLVCQVDTLVLRKTHFIEYNRLPRDYQIQQLVFRTTACYGTCPVFSLQLNRSGAATYQAREYTQEPGDFTATVEARRVAELWQLLNYLDFPRLKRNYTIPVTDHPTCLLTITYAGGKVKTIEDYGEQGTFGLQQAYELLFRLRTTQAWKKATSLNSR